MNDPGFWGQSWWQGVSGILAFISIILTVLTIIVQNKKKRLGYRLLITKKSAKIKFDSKSKLKASNNKNNTLITMGVQIINIGKIPIKKDDFEEPITVNFPSCQKIVSTEVTDYKPDNLKIRLDVNEKGLIINPLLLNPSDRFTIKVDLDTEKIDYDINARIEDINEIENIGLKNFQNYERSFELVNLLATLFIMVDFYNIAFGIDTKITDVYYPIATVVIIGFIIYNLRHLYILRRK